MGKEKVETKMSKNENDKCIAEAAKKKRVGEKKKTSEDSARKYGYISLSSVTTIAESAGFHDINEEVAKNLAEDVSYRLRSIIQQCSKYMRHTRQRRLTCTDVNQVFEMCDVLPVYGHADNESYKFTFIKEADVFVIEDHLVDLVAFALEETVESQKPPLSVTGMWHVSDMDKPNTDKSKAEGGDSAAPGQASKNIKQNHVSNSSSGGGTKPDVAKTENHKVTNSDSAEDETNIPTNLIKYYGITCNTILGHSSLKGVTQDLSKNSRILPIIPYLLNFISITLNKLSSERQVKRILQVVEALTENQGVDLTPYLPTSRVVSAILMIAGFDKTPAKVTYDCGLRQYAACVLAKVFKKWCYRDEQRAVVVKKMVKVLNDMNMPSKIHYGAIVLLTALGPDILNAFWNLLKQYLSFLQMVKDKLGVKAFKDVSMLEEMILNAAQVLYEHPHLQDKPGRKSVLALDQCLQSYFGDRMCVVRKNYFEDPRYLYQRYRALYGPETDNKPPELAAKRQTKAMTMKYMSTRYKPEAIRPTIDAVFELPPVQKKRNPRLVFNSHGALPENSLKRRRLDSGHSQFIPGKESEGHVVVVGKFSRRPRNIHFGRLKTGSIFSVL